MIPLPRKFFKRDAVQVAPQLLGKILSVNDCLSRIVETEAYEGDSASHAFKRTARSAVMFDTYGYVYVYLIYGMHYCVNITTNKVGDAGAVLIRAVQPLTGMEFLIKRRKTTVLPDLCNGPGKLCAALGITKMMNGVPLGNGVQIFDDKFKVGKIASSSRIGIKDAQDLPWRFFIEGNEFVSKVKLKKKI